MIATKNKKPPDFLAFDLDHRIIWLQVYNNGISNTVALNFEKAVNKLNEAGNEDIKFFISGPGGDFFACLKIMYLIDESASKFITVAFDCVRSGCFFLTQAKGVKERLAVPGTKLIFHQAVDTYHPEKPKIFTLNQAEYERRRSRLQLIDACQALIFSERGRPLSQIFKFLLGETRLSTERALKLKLLDGLFSEEEFEKYRKLIFRNLRKSKKAA